MMKIAPAAFLLFSTFASISADDFRPTIGNDLIIDEFRNLPDPTHWSTARKGTNSVVLFRRATQSELDQNRWDPGTFLVQFDKPSSPTSSPLTLHVPLGDDWSLPIDLVPAGSVRGPYAVENRVLPEDRIATITGPTVMNNYVSSFEMVQDTSGPRRHLEEEIPRKDVIKDIGNGLMKLTIVDSSMYGRGAVEGYEVEVMSMSSTWHVDSVIGSTDGPHTVDPSTLVKVSLKNVPEPIRNTWADCDGLAICNSYCGYLGGPFYGDSEDDHPCSGGGSGGGGPSLSNDKNFGLFGDAPYCTYLGESWKAQMADLAYVVQNSFRSEDLSLLPVQLRYGVISCWIFPSMQDAEDCDELGGANCAPFNGGAHVYPYAGANHQEEMYREYVGNDLAHAKSVGLPNLISTSNVIHRGNLDDDAGLVCGVAIEGGGHEHSGRSVSSGGTMVGQCSAIWKCASHEIGHTLGATHEDYPPGPGDKTFMVSGYFPSPYGFLSPANEAIVNPCLAAAACPRAPE